MRKHILTLFAGLCLSWAVQAQDAREHIVQRGETFTLIAKRYGMTEEQLKEANPKVKICYAGLKLQVPEAFITTSTTSLAAGAEKEAKKAADRSSENFIADAKSQNRNGEEAAVNKKKKGKSFWKSLGEIASTVGDVVVTTAGAMSEAGLLDDTGNTGQAIAGTADIVNMARGQQSNYLAEATAGEVSNEYVETGVFEDVNGDDYQVAAQSGGNEDAIAAIDRQIAALRQEDEQLERQKNTSIMYTKPSAAMQTARVKAKKGQKLTRSDIMARTSEIRAQHSTSAMKQDLALAKRQSEIQRQIRSLLQQKAELTGNPDAVNEKSAFERERSIRARVYNDPKVKQARMKAANIHNYQQSRNVALDEVYKLTHDPDYRSEYKGDERDKLIEAEKAKAKKYERLINE